MYSAIIKETIFSDGGRNIETGDVFYNVSLGGEIKEYKFLGFVRKTKKNKQSVIETCIFGVRILTERSLNFNNIWCEYPHPDEVLDNEPDEFKNFEWLKRNLNTFDYQKAVELSKKIVETQNTFI